MHGPFSAQISSFAVSRWNISVLNFRANFRKPLVYKVNILLLVENEVCKFLFIVNKYESVIVIRRTVIGLTLAYSCKASVDILIRDVIFYAEISVIKAQLTQSYPAYFFAGIEVVNMLCIVYIFLVNALEFGLTETKQICHPFSFIMLSEYHLSGSLFMINAPRDPPMKPTINPPSTSLGK